MADRINSKAKGSKNERDICKWWEEWTGYDFSRVPSSGGLRWQRTLDTTGDILCSDKKHCLKFPFSIECKSYKEIKFEHVLLGNKSCDVLKFWEQASEDAKRGEKQPILMMRYNSMPKNEYFFVVSRWVGEILLSASDSESDRKLLTPYMTLRLPESKGLMIFMASKVADHTSYVKVYEGLKEGLAYLRKQDRILEKVTHKKIKELKK